MLQLLDLLVILKDNDSAPSYWSKNKKQNNKKYKKKYKTKQKTEKRLNYSVLIILSCHYYWNYYYKISIW